ncbi:Class I glutamine amidotransferase-like [Phytophthora cactorum]|nr:Class I glutamine amidotransferase-like [Phytophthora cactorum]
MWRANPSPAGPLASASNGGGDGAGLRRWQRAQLEERHPRGGTSVKDVTCVEDIRNADVLIFPGVGNFRAAMEFLNASGYVEELKNAVRGFGGVPELKGLGVIKGKVARFPSEKVTVPHIGWNGINAWKKSALFASLPVSTEYAKVYFVHSFRATKTDKNADWVLSTTNYGDLEFVSAVQRVTGSWRTRTSRTTTLDSYGGLGNSDVALQAYHCGDLVVTKGDQYDVRETSDSAEGGNVRNMGKPVDLCKRYFEEGADEVAFLNITSFREQPMGDLPMAGVLEASSECVFVPLTIGGGIPLYFRSGADKVSIGSDAVYTAEKYYANGGKGDGTSSIETISAVYGNQAVVVSMDPKRVYVASFYDENAKGHNVVKLSQPGPNGEEYCWYQMTVRGGRETRDIDVVQLAQAVEALGAGELLLNCVDMDGQKAGYDLDLISLVKKSVRIPVIASSGAGKPQHFTEVFEKTNCDAALAAGIFHRKEVAIQEVKAQLHTDNISVRL